MTDWTWHKRAQSAIAQAYLTNSKRPESLVKGVYPTHMARGQGCWLWDHFGKKYLDFVCGLGTNLLGYSHDLLVGAVSEWVRRGWSHSLGTHLEVETAEKLKEAFPAVDAWKFLKSGSEACNAAVKIARAATGRNWILSEGYHGIGDDFVSLVDPALGVPREPHYPRPIASLEGMPICKETAAVIVEPVVTDASPERRKWLESLREACTKAGALLVFDEVITGLRWPKFSVSGAWGITPDLVVLGKALGGGLPIAAVGGKYAVMNGAEYFVSSTYAGETLSLAAAKATVTLLQTKFDLGQLWEKAGAWVAKFNAACDGVVQIEGYPTRGVLRGADLPKALFMQEACRAGMLFGPSFFFGFPHIEAAPDALPAIGAIAQRIRGGEVRLAGEAPKSPFAQQVREKRS